jgi:predicted small secreted protein
LIKKSCVITLLACLGMLLTACNTMAGMGKDTRPPAGIEARPEEVRH